MKDRAGLARKPPKRTANPPPPLPPNYPLPCRAKPAAGAANNLRSDSHHNESQPEPASHPDSRYNLRTWSSAGIEPDTMSAPPALPPQPASTYDATTAAKTDIAYTPGDEQTWYFNAGGNPVDQASAGGYYRKALGKTADGRLVAQDYYQDSHSPQTAPFILVKDADPHDFDTTTADSKVVWYRKDGSISSVQTFAGGKAQSRMNIYQDGRLVAQMPRPQDRDESTDPYRSAGEADKGIRYYYENGQLLALDYGHRVLNCYNGCKSWNILYDENGQPLAAYHGERTNDIVLSKYWNTLNHTPADEQTARRQTFDAALERLDELRQMRQQDGL